ncbi:Gfo/Idh/MocA family oxidoreductase [Luteitalea sp.]|uniref:Gfo/Idh/MocA family protein n=1 Tax=Luteitalea sp. TaxID=2004800 RepID=UPI0025C0C143|nr:Gfo/Idh/MocA family oxidoreductase [Luteitalea sp.]
MSELKIGIVGLGWVAEAHIETFKHVTGASVTAVCSRRELTPAALQAQYGQPLKAYRDYADMLADPDIDAIDICTPHPYHAEQAIAAANAGKHLIIEKPIALSWEDARRVQAAIRANGVKAMVCLEVRYSAQFTLTRSVVEQGLLGDLHFGEVDYYHGIGPWYGQYGWNIKKDMGASSLLTAGIHAMDILLMLMSSPVEEVTAYGTTSSSEHFTPYEYPTTTISLLKFAGGQVGKVTSCIDCLQPYYFHSHLVGSHGTLLDTKLHTTRLPGMIKTRWSELATHPIDSGDVSDHPYQPQFQAFVDSTLAGTTMPLTDFDTALESHRVAYAADLSVQRGVPVTLSELA